MARVAERDKFQKSYAYHLSPYRLPFDSFRNRRNACCSFDYSPRYGIRLMFLFANLTTPPTLVLDSFVDTHRS